LVGKARHPSQLQRRPTFLSSRGPCRKTAPANTHTHQPNVRTDVGS
jgi:hypothetical protein